MNEITYILINGKYCNSETAVFSTANRAFLFGDCISVWLRVCNGKVCYFEEHLDRITEAMRTVGFNVPEKFAGQQVVLKDELLKLVNKNKMFKGAVVRLSVFRTDGKNILPDNDNAEYTAEAFALESGKFTLNRKGLVLTLYNKIPLNVNIFSNFSSAADGLVRISAARYTVTECADDAVLVNTLGNIVDSVFGGNVFIIKDKQILTPRLDDGSYNDVMRMQILEAAMESGYEPVTKNHITAIDLESADEIFTASTHKGINWIGAYNNRRFYKTAAEVICEKLNAKYIN